MRVLPLILIATACGSPTQLVVLIGSDYSVPAELAAIQTIITDDEGTAVGGEFFDLSRFGLPMSFGIEGGDLKDEQVRVLIQGLTSRDELLVERTAIVGFVKGEKRLLPMFLARRCASISCGGDQTCTELGCATPVIDAETLPEVEPGEELGFPQPKPEGDAGQPDAIVSPDADVPGDCIGSDQCPLGSLCVEPDGADCSGFACDCKMGCPPLSTTVVCDPQDECYFRIDDGVCLDRNSSPAVNYRGPCMLATDCDPFENWFCRHLSDPSPGECTSLCFDSDYCNQRVPGTICDLEAFGGQPYGLCLELAPPIGDVGDPCMTDLDCQDTCIIELGACAAPCSGLTACPVDSLCSISQNGSDAWCVQSCFDDSDCANNPNFVCREDFGFSPPGLCFFPCDPALYPCAGGLVCDLVSGHCM